MTLSQMILSILVFLVILVFIMFPEARSLFKGIGKIFIKDLATTPEGAAAIYSEKIEEVEERYNKADDALKMAAGKLSNAKKDLERLKSRVTTVEKECETLVKEGRMELAAVKADEREELISDIKRVTELVKAYTTAEQTAREAHQICEQNLRKLKRESKEVVENLKLKSQLKETYDDMEELKNITATDKMLDHVREKNKDLDAMVEGAKTVYDSKASTKIQKAEVEARKHQSSDYLESLKKKYNK